MSLVILGIGLVIAFILLISLAMNVKKYGEEMRAIQTHLNEVREREARPAVQPPAKAETSPIAAAPLPQKPAAAPQKTPAAEAGIPGEVLAVLAAAAYTMIPGGVVTSVRKAAAPAPIRARSPWGMAGLLESTRPF